MKQLNEEERLLEALASFRGLWNLYYPSKGCPRRKGTSIDINGLQEAWNIYTRLNRKFHGAYVPVSDPMFLK